MYRLHEVFCQVTSEDAGEIMLYEEFCLALDFSPSSLLVQRIFDTFDAYHVQALNFQQFALVCSFAHYCCLLGQISDRLVLLYHVILFREYRFFQATVRFLNYPDVCH